MSVSGGSRRGPAGLDQALVLLDAIRNADEYEKMLKPLREAAAKADEAQAKLGLAGDVLRLRTEAQKSADDAAAVAAKAKTDAQAKLSALDREYSLKSADLRSRTDAFNRDKSAQEEALAEREAELGKQRATLAQRQAQLEKGQAQLAAAQEQLERDREEVGRRFAAIKEAFNG